MKLRLVREDGTAGTLDDLRSNRVVIEIDGVDMLVQRIERYSLDQSVACLDLSMAYKQDPDGYRLDHQGFVRMAFSPPFASYRARRATKPRPLDADERRRRERTEWRP